MVVALPVREKAILITSRVSFSIFFGKMVTITDNKRMNRKVRTHEMVKTSFGSLGLVSSAKITFQLRIQFCRRED